MVVVAAVVVVVYKLKTKLTRRLQTAFIYIIHYHLPNTTKQLIKNKLKVSFNKTLLSFPLTNPYRPPLIPTRKQNNPNKKLLIKKNPAIYIPYEFNLSNRHILFDVSRYRDWAIV